MTKPSSPHVELAQTAFPFPVRDQSPIPQDMLDRIAALADFSTTDPSGPLPTDPRA